MQTKAYLFVVPIVRRKVLLPNPISSAAAGHTLLASSFLSWSMHNSGCCWLCPTDIDLIMSLANESRLQVATIHNEMDPIPILGLITVSLVLTVDFDRQSSLSLIIQEQKH